MLKILVTDDSPTSRAIISRLIGDVYEVRAAASGADALAELAAGGVDLLLLDLLMPGMDGWTIFRMMRQDAAFNDTPIAILTAKSQQVDQMVGLHIMNADAYITKPFGKQELIDKTYELIGKRKKSPDTGR